MAPTTLTRTGRSRSATEWHTGAARSAKLRCPPWCRRAVRGGRCRARVYWVRRTLVLSVALVLGSSGSPACWRAASPRATRRASWDPTSGPPPRPRDRPPARPRTRCRVPRERAPTGREGWQAREAGSPRPADRPLSRLRRRRDPEGLAPPTPAVLVHLRLKLTTETSQACTLRCRRVGCPQDHLAAMTGSGRARTVPRRCPTISCCATTCPPRWTWTGAAGAPTSPARASQHGRAAAATTSRPRPWAEPTGAVRARAAGRPDPRPPSRRPTGRQRARPQRREPATTRASRATSRAARTEGRRAG